MKIRSSAIALGAATLLTSAAAVPALAGTSASATSHTLTFTSVTERSLSLSKTTGAQQDRDVNAKGKVVGFDELYFSFGAKGGTANVAVVTAGGVLYGTIKITQTSMNGKVTGGTGKFAGARGTITARNLNAKGTRTAVTVRYH